ncbi:type II secretory pathway predicted ATPase ExeA [Paenibacillus sp. V4I3]|nr:type II secretory pathway predicted ATPase ExeA [Paenibacillus sp. V4I3]
MLLAISSDFSSNDYVKTITRIKGSVIKHIEFRKVIDAISECHNSSKIGCPNNLLLTGSSGSGKSALLSYYKNKYLERYNGDSVFPILYLKSPLHAKPRELAISLLEQMDVNYRNNLSLSSMTNKVVESITQLGIELIMLDDIEHLFDATSLRIHSDSVEWLRMLFDNLQVSVILSGLEVSNRLLLHNAAFASRVLSRVTLSPLDEDEYALFLQTIDSYLPFSEKLWLTEQAIEKLYLTTDGLPGYTKEIIIKATRLAFEEDRLTDWHIIKTCNLLSRSSQNSRNLDFVLLDDQELHTGQYRRKSKMEKFI